MLFNFSIILSWIIFSITEVTFRRPRGAAALLQLVLTKPSDLLPSPTINWEKRREQNKKCQLYWQLRNDFCSLEYLYKKVRARNKEWQDRAKTVVSTGITVKKIPLYCSFIRTSQQRERATCIHLFPSQQISHLSTKVFADVQFKFSFC